MYRCQKTNLILAPMPLFGQSSAHRDLLFHRSILRSFPAVCPAEIYSNHMLSQWRIKIAPGDQCYPCFKSLTPFYDGTIAVSSKYQHHAGGAWPRASSHDESVFLLVAATQNWNLKLSWKIPLIHLGGITSSVDSHKTNRSEGSSNKASACLPRLQQQSQFLGY